jgi:pimeloyl-ACP methyl ester carboxylesterase
MSGTLLGPDEMYPASATGVSVRMIDLPTGVRVRVAERGPDRGMPVVMLHGWGASLYTFRHAFESLPARGIRVIAPDLRGFGLSTRPAQTSAYSMDSYIADLESLIEALELDRPALGGHSMGGGIALRYALRWPQRVRALALFAPTGLVPATALFPLRAMPRFAVEAIGERLVPRWMVEWILRHAAFGNVSRLTARDVDEYWAPTQIPGFIRAVRRTASEFDWDPVSDQEAGSLAVPAAVVLGTGDRLIRNAGAAARRLAGAEVRELSGGHCIHEERPGEVYEFIGGHLLRQARR